MSHSHGRAFMIQSQSRPTLVQKGIYDPMNV